MSPTPSGRKPPRSEWLAASCLAGWRAAGSRTCGFVLGRLARGFVLGGPRPRACAVGGYEKISAAPLRVKPATHRQMHQDDERGDRHAREDDLNGCMYACAHEYEEGDDVGTSPHEYEEDFVIQLSFSIQSRIEKVILNSDSD